MCDNSTVKRQKAKLNYHVLDLNLHKEK